MLIRLEHMMAPCGYPFGSLRLDGNQAIQVPIFVREVDIRRHQPTGL